MTDGKYWAYLGDFGGATSDVPGSACMTGLVRRKETPTAFAEFEAQCVGNMALDLFLDAEQANFVRLCLADRLQVFAQGYPLLRSRSRILFCKKMAVWVGEGASLAQVSSGTAELLVRSARNRAAESLWSSSVRALSWTSPGASGYLHPGAQDKAQRLAPRLLDNAGEHQLLINTFLFVLQQETTACMETAPLAVQRLVRLGTSELYFDTVARTCSVAPQSVPQYYTTPLRACVVAADCIRSMLLAAVMLADADLSPLDKTLVVAPRDALPEAVAAFTSAFDDEVYVVPKERRACPHMASRARVVVMQSEIFERDSCLRNFAWKRLCLFAWNRVAIPVSFSADFIVAFSTLAELDAFEPEGFVRKTAELFGISADDLESPGSVQALIDERFIKLKSQGPEICTYRFIQGPPSESPLSQSYSSARLDLFGENLASSDLRFRKVEIGEVERFMLKHSMHRLTSYAMEHFQRPSEACPICLNGECDAVTVCGHWFCNGCLWQALHTRERADCPMCKMQLRARKDVCVVRSAEGEAEGEEFLAWLEGRLSLFREEKTVLSIAFGEMHEKLSKRFRALGINALAWRGNARHVMHVYKTFCEASSGVLLVDAAAFPVSWVRFSGVHRVLFVQPLSLRRNLDVCCQMRAVLVATRPETVEVYSRRESPGVPQFPYCRSEQCLTCVRQD